jgi:DedD protein
MSSLNSGGTANLPQPIEPPRNIQAQAPIDEDPLFEPMTIDDAPSQEDSLDNVAKKIKEQSQKEEDELITGPDETFMEEPTPVVVPAKYEKPVQQEVKEVVKKAVVKEPVTKTVKKVATTTAVKGNYYIQVGSFGRFSPDEKFLQKITGSGYSYKLHKVDSVTKVLVGPYETDKAARRDLNSVRANIEPGAFLSRI